MVKIDIEMPTKCSECRFFQNVEGFKYCSVILKQPNDEIYNAEEKKENCPLIKDELKDDFT